jgi:hypothetical protein
VMAVEPIPKAVNQHLEGTNKRSLCEGNLSEQSPRYVHFARTPSRLHGA